MPVGPSSNFSPRSAVLGSFLLFIFTGCCFCSSPELPSSPLLFFSSSNYFSLSCDYFARRSFCNSAIFLSFSKTWLLSCSMSCYFSLIFAFEASAIPIDSPLCLIFSEISPCNFSFCSSSFCVIETTFISLQISISFAMKSVLR